PLHQCAASFPSSRPTTPHRPCVVHFFFFSSRRRHTRFSRDWSSDVCSSDLHVCPPEVLVPHKALCACPTRTGRQGTSRPIPGKRSEERRVGKECRSLWTT